MNDLTLKGFSAADNWTVELTAETEADAVRLIAAALPQHPEYAALLKLDMVAVRRQCTSLRVHFNIPGLRCLNKPIDEEAL